MQIDKNIILQIFGSLMKNPLLLGEVDKYNLTPYDFSNSFEKYIFSAIYNLFQNGAERISVVDIDNYLSSFEGAYSVFKRQNGIEYLQDAEDLSIEENFQYYYDKLKKINAIRDLKKEGFKTSNIYPDDFSDDDAETILDKFETMTIEDIFSSIKNKIINLESKYNVQDNTVVGKASDGIRELLEKLKEAPDFGANLQGDIFNTIVRGARKGKYYVRSAGSGVGKTRSMIGDACQIAYPIRYSQEKQKWIFTGSNEKVLYIATEQEPEEIQTMILAYLSGIEEEKIKSGFINEEEEAILNKSMDIMEYFNSNLIIAQIPNPTILEVKTFIRKQCLTENIQNVFYDYIFSSPGLLGEFRDLRIREDRVMLMSSKIAFPFINGVTIKWLTRKTD